MVTDRTPVVVIVSTPTRTGGGHGRLPARQRIERQAVAGASEDRLGVVGSGWMGFVTLWPVATG